MNTMTPAACREEAVRQGRLAKEAYRIGDSKKAEGHIDRAIELFIRALELEADANPPEGVIPPDSAWQPRDSTPAVPVAE